MSLGNLQPGEVFKSMTNSPLQTIKPSMSADPSGLDVNILMVKNLKKLNLEFQNLNLKTISH